MANHAWLYFIEAEALLRHRISVKRERVVIPGLCDVLRLDVQPASQTDSEAVPLLDWIAQVYSQENEQSDGRRAIAEYLFEHRPGMIRAADFRGESWLDQELATLARDNADLRERLGLELDSQWPQLDRHHEWEEWYTLQLKQAQVRRTRFLQRMPQPLHALNFRGWNLIDRQDMAALFDGFHSVNHDQLYFVEEWEGAFALHRRQHYDFAALISTSEAL